nr:MAG TPA: hypothetical protein [Caudoviricetes sp.]DAM39407.1 MAG TPA: hypothetical protein [Caudoviricetes sp.]
MVYFYRGTLYNYPCYLLSKIKPILYTIIYKISLIFNSIFLYYVILYFFKILS